ncbi:MAG: hypothetical protein HC853_01225 [Anaerolineae bacterium]|nr:hypothetical protein [Anaerolineae bacterium]
MAQVAGEKEDAQFKWGTPRANALKLIDESLQGRVIVVYDKVFKDGKSRLVFNQAETLAAVEKQDAIRQAFEKWIWDDADRAERLVRIYNDTHNAHVARRYDGSHLHFEGINQSVLTTGDLWPQQKDAVWRILTSLSVLLAHKVGAGKTYVMAAAAYEAKRLGLAHKPMLVTLNNLVEQCATTSSSCIREYGCWRLRRKSSAQHGDRSFVAAWPQATGTWSSCRTPRFWRCTSPPTWLTPAFSP